VQCFRTVGEKICVLKNRSMLTPIIFKRLLKKSDCDFSFHALTSAFDGQADETQLLRAAQHCESCAHCQALWSDWEKTRALLRGVPAPVVPTSLNQKILSACRSLPDEEYSAPQSPFVRARTDLDAYFEAANEEFSVARLAPLMPEVAPPSHLSHQILECTVRAKQPLRASLWPVVRDYFLGGSTPGTRAVRWGAGLAAPALAAWLLFVVQPSLVKTSFDETSTPANSRVPIAATDLEPAAEPEKTAPKSAASRMPPRIAAESSVPKKAALPRANAKSPNSQVAFAGTVRAPRDISPPHLVQASLDQSRRKPALKKPAQKKPAQNRATRTLPLLDGSVNAAPRLARVVHQSSVPSPHLATSHPDVAHRISKPVLEKPAPRLADVRLVAADFDETLSAIARQRDNRPEELGLALDEYSASLLAENAGENDEEWG
jgi:hypothetical protein